MKKTNLKRDYKCPTNIIAIGINTALILIIPSSDLIDWVFRIIELLTFIKIWMTSWKWRISNGIPTLFFLNTPKINK